MTEVLQPFQRRFERAAMAPIYETAALCAPRGNGKSWLSARFLKRALTPGDPMFFEGTESVLCAASTNQARIVFKFLRKMVADEDDYSWVDSQTKIGVTHKRTRTKVTVISSSGKTAMGLVDCPYAVCDEPGSWEVNGGQLMSDALFTAQGKPGSPLKIIIIGTLAPAESGWWHDLINDGTRGRVYVQALQGDAEKWRHAREIRRVNPLTKVAPEFVEKLFSERADAFRDTRLKARFLSYRLNRPTADESKSLLTVEDWAEVEARAGTAKEGKPVIGIDLGGGRAWSAAVALWQSGACEAIAVAPGVPLMHKQEARDQVPRGTYQKLVDMGCLRVATGKKVQPPSMLIKMIKDKWGDILGIVCDRFRLSDMEDCDEARGLDIQFRLTRWSEAAADIRALRKSALDGPLNCTDPASIALLKASLTVATVKNDDQGSTRLVKRGNNNEARDDVAQALVLAAGADSRRPKPRKLRWFIA